MDNEKNGNREISNIYEMSQFPTYYYKMMTSKWFQKEKIVAEILHEIFQPGNLPGKRLLDFGCGPFAYRMASPSLQFKDIVLAEYAETNRKELEKWLNNDSNSFDLTPFYQKTAILEGFREISEGVERIEERIRHSVKMVVSCDGLNQDILPKGIGKFDVITCFYCITNFAFSEQEHRRFLEKLSASLNHHGVLVILMVFGVDKYYVHQWIDHYPLERESFRKIIKDAGLRILNWYDTEDCALNETHCIYTLTKM